MYVCVCLSVCARKRRGREGGREVEREGGKEAGIGSMCVESWDKFVELA